MLVKPGQPPANGDGLTESQMLKMAKSNGRAGPLSELTPQPPIFGGKSFGPGPEPGSGS